MSKLVETFNHQGARLFAFALLVIVLELTLFNYPYWLTRSLMPEIIQGTTHMVASGEVSEKEYADSFGAPAVEDEEADTVEDAFSGSEENDEQIFRNAVSTFTVTFDEPRDIATLSIRTSAKATFAIRLFDEGNQVEGAPFEYTVMPNPAQGHIFQLHAYGKVHAIEFELIDSEAHSRNPAIPPVLTVYQVDADTPVPFTFCWLRVVLLFAVIAFVSIFNPRSRLAELTLHSPRAKHMIALATVVAIVIFLLACFVQTSYTRTLSFGLQGLSYIHPDRTQAEYADLARALAHGQVSLLYEPSAELEHLSNPYDYGARLSQHMRAVWDLAYYDGKYYVYFGILPALVFHLPFYLLTGLDFPTPIAAMVMIVAFIIGVSFFVCRVVREFFPQTSLLMALLLIIALDFSSLIIYCSRQPILYTLPVIMALACLVWGAYCYVVALKRTGFIVVGSLLLASIAAARPQMLAFCLLLIPLGLKVLRNQQTKGGKVGLCVGALLPYAVAFALIGWYNAARFGSPLNFGSAYNLTGNDMTHRPFSFEATALYFFYYFLQPPAIDLTFPYVHATPFDASWGGWLVREDMFGGLFFICPLTLFAISLIWSDARKLKLFVAVSLLLAVIVALFDGIAAGLLARYQMDFAFVASFAGAVAVLYWENGGLPSGERRALARPLARMVKACVIITALICLGILFTPYSSGVWGLDYFVSTMSI